MVKKFKSEKRVPSFSQNKNQRKSNFKKSKADISVEIFEKKLGKTPAKKISGKATGTFAKNNKISKQVKGTSKKTAYSANSAEQTEYNSSAYLQPEEPNLNIVEGRNPVTELLRSDNDIDKLFVAKDATGSIGQIIALAREKKIPLSYCDRHKLDAISQTGSHQGVIAYRAAHNYSQLSDIFKLAEEKGEKPLIVICDKITDPHNMGAIIRSAEVVGAHGVIIPKRESAGLNAICAKTSAGAIEYVPIVRVNSLATVIAELKSRGIWIIGAEADAENGIFDTDFNIPLAVVIGSEGEGISRLVRDNCDMMINIPVRGKVNSLNASAAAAVLLFEVLRSRIKNI